MISPISACSPTEYAAVEGRLHWLPGKRALANRAWWLRQKPMPLLTTFPYFLKGIVSRQTVRSLMRLCLTSSERILPVLPQQIFLTRCTHLSQDLRACFPTWHSFSPIWRPSLHSHL